MTAELEILAPGPLTTVQDLGRPGYARMGVGASGAADRSALRRSNRLVGNPEGAAALEATFGGLELRASTGVLLALTGSDPQPSVDGRPVGHSCLLRVPAAAVLRLAVPASGVRTYLAVRGGVAVPPVLGSRSTDVLSGLGPPVLQAGMRLPVGPPPGWSLPPVDWAPVDVPGEGDLRLGVLLGPRDDWFTPAALDALTSAVWTVSPDSNRVGMRLTGPRLDRRIEGELPSEGLAPGSLQIPPMGMPTLFLSDHPLTGGYPVVAVVTGGDLDRAGQARPGQRVRFTVVSSASS